MSSVKMERHLRWIWWTTPSIRIPFSENEVRYVRKGQRVEMETHAFPGKILTGTIEHNPMAILSRDMPASLSAHRGGDVATGRNAEGQEVPAISATHSSALTAVGTAWPVPTCRSGWLRICDVPYEQHPATQSLRIQSLAVHEGHGSRAGESSVKITP